MKDGIYYAATDERPESRPLLFSSLEEANEWINNCRIMCEFVGAEMEKGDIVKVEVRKVE
jgi:hypothetical protein